MKTDAFSAADLFIVCAAFRYALGRRSYAPGLVMRWIKDHAKDLTDELRKQIARETREQNSRGGLDGEREYQRDWLAFADWLEAYAPE